MTNNSKTILYITLVVIILAAGGVIYFLWDKLSDTKSEMSEMVELMTYEKEQLENEYTDLSLEIEGMSIKVNNDSLLHQLDKEQKRVQLLLEELRTVKATNARRIAELKAELASVRKVLVYYVNQVDSLSSINSKLQTENRQVHDKYQQATTEVQNLSEEKQRLTAQVAIASQLEARDILVELQTARGRKARSIRRLAVIKISYTISKNITAEVGNKTIYMRIATPDDQVLQKSSTDLFQYENKQIEYSACKSFEFTGEELTDVLYYTVTETLWAGDYRVDLFVDGHLIGYQTFTLKK